MIGTMIGTSNPYAEQGEEGDIHRAEGGRPARARGAADKGAGEKHLEEIHQDEHEAAQQDELLKRDLRAAKVQDRASEDQPSVAPDAAWLTARSFELQERPMRPGYETTYRVRALPLLHEELLEKWGCSRDGALEPVQGLRPWCIQRNETQLAPLDEEVAHAGRGNHGVHRREPRFPSGERPPGSVVESKSVLDSTNDDEVGARGAPRRHRSRGPILGGRAPIDVSAHLYLGHQEK